MREFHECLYLPQLTYLDPNAPYRPQNSRIHSHHLLSCSSALCFIQIGHLEAEKGVFLPVSYRCFILAACGSHISTPTPPTDPKTVEFIRTVPLAMGALCFTQIGHLEDEKGDFFPQLSLLHFGNSWLTYLNPNSPYRPENSRIHLHCLLSHGICFIQLAIWKSRKVSFCLSVVAASFWLLVAHISQPQLPLQTPKQPNSFVPSP